MARCAQHPDAEAVAACARCGGFLCGACVQLADDAALCAPCLRLLGLDGPVLPRRVQVALAAGVLGLAGLAFACTLAPVPSLLLGALAVWAVRGEQAPAGLHGVGALARRQRWTRVARAVGWANVGLASLYLLVLAGLLGALWLQRRGG